VQKCIAVIRASLGFFATISANVHSEGEILPVFLPDYIASAVLTAAFRVDFRGEDEDAASHVRFD
jgi:hypothetical protein